VGERLEVCRRMVRRPDRLWTTVESASAATRRRLQRVVIRGGVLGCAGAMVLTSLFLKQTVASPPHPDAGTETWGRPGAGEGVIPLDRLGTIGIGTYDRAREQDFDPCGVPSDRPRVIVKTLHLTPSSHGGVSTSPEVDAAIDRHRSRLEQCYFRTLSKNPGLCGQVIVSFEVNASGKVQDAIADKSSLGAAKVERCALASVRHLTFKPHGVSVDDERPFSQATLRFAFIAPSAKAHAPEANVERAAVIPRDRSRP